MSILNKALSDHSIMMELRALLMHFIDAERYPHLSFEAISQETHLLSLPLDSLALSEFVMAVEEVFDIYLPIEEAFKFVQVRDLVQYIQAELQRRAQHEVAP